MANEPDQKPESPAATGDRLKDGGSFGSTSGQGVPVDQSNHADDNITESARVSGGQIPNVDQEDA